MKNIYYFILLFAFLNTGFAQETEEVIVTSSLGGATLAEIDSPIFVIKGDDINFGATTSLGENLNSLLGVNSSDFGPGVGQPIIRGMGGTRVKILSNGKLVRDVSGLGSDHLNDVDMNNVQQIEIVRGPSSLLYSNGTMGGIVNVVDQTIASKDFDGNNFNIGLERQSVNQGTTGNFSYQGNVNDVNITYGFKNVNFENYDVPAFSIIHEGTPEGDETLKNSDFARTSQKFGTSAVRDWGYLGFSIGKGENTYGIAYHGEHEDEHEGEHEGEDDERIQVDTDSENLTLEGSATNLSGLESFNYFLQVNDYTFIEGHIGGKHNGESTTYTNESYEIGLKGDISGLSNSAVQNFTININQEDIKIVKSDDDEVPFMKPVESQTLSLGYFYGQEFGMLDIDFGVRLDQVSRDGTYNTTTHDISESDLSTALTLGWNLENNLGLSLGISSVARAPSELELFMNGKHLVAARIERGNVNLESERSNNIDFSLDYENDGYFLNASVYSNSVDSYIYLLDSGTKIDKLPVTNFTQADADFNGYEIEVGRSFALNNGDFIISYGRDEVVGTFSSGGNVPRITPVKNIYSFAYSQQDITYDIKIKDIQKEDDLGLGETVTNGFTMVDFDITRSISIGNDEELVLSVFGSNLLDEKARSHTSYAKDPVPLAGRNFGIKLNFNF
ncbi:MAG: TonB-dependent receptor [Gammaproteobacteria bacterium]|nr:MAG: TonB-dependent receptor [Gammaproteobacteria bacterium]